MLISAASPERGYGQIKWAVASCGGLSLVRDMVQILVSVCLSQPFCYKNILQIMNVKMAWCQPVLEA